MPAPAHVQAATLDKFIAGWRKWTPDDMMAVWTVDCQQRMLPLSMGHPFRSPDQVKVTLSKLMQTLTNYELKIYDVVHDAEKSKAVVHATSTADTPFADYKWTNEYAVFISFTEDGQQINRIEEMVDTAFFQSFYPKFQAYWNEETK